MMQLTLPGIAENVRQGLQQAGRLQVVHAPALSIFFYQWLLTRARAGVQIEVLLAQSNGLTAQYIQHLEQAGGKVFQLPEKLSTTGLILFDEAVLIVSNEAHGSNATTFSVEESPAGKKKWQELFNHWKAAGQISISEAAPAKTMLVHFTASPQQVGIHERFELVWDVSGADEVVITPLPGLVAAQGRQFLSAERSTEFCLTASNQQQSISRVLQVAVDEHPKIDYLFTLPGRNEQEDLLLPPQPGQPDRFAVVQGQPLRLYWRVYNANQVSLDGREVPPVGHLLLTPTQFSAYTLVATGESGTVNKILMVDVVAPAENLPFRLPSAVQTANQLTIPAMRVFQPLEAPVQSGAQQVSNAAGVARDPSPFSSLHEFFWFCSGASRTILRQCPTSEGNKMAGMGATVFFTGLLAAISGGYALYVAFQNLVAAIFFGLLWGGAIFNLDRLIVSTIKKEASSTRQWQQALPRFLLALVLSVVIAKPLELRIFKPELDQVLSEKKQEKLLRTEVLFRKKALDIETNIERIKAETAAALSMRESLYQEYRCECDGTCGTGKIGRGTECARKEAKYRQAESEYQALKSDNDQLLAAARADITQLKTQEQQALQQVANVQANGLVAQLSAASELPFAPSFFITLLIFMIEIAPVLAKLLAPRGAYDDALLNETARFNLQQEELLRQQQSTSDQEAARHVQLRQAQLDTELDHRQELLRIIAAGQAKIVQEQVDKWVNKERKKMKNDE